MSIIPLLHLLDFFLAEALGTGAIVLFGCMCTIVFSNIPSILQVGFGFGNAVLASVVTVGHISGAYFNPAIIVSALILDRITIKKASAYLLAQIIGSICGYAILMFITPKTNRCDKLMEICIACVNQPQNDVTVFQALLAEFFATSLLVFAVCSIWDPRSNQTADSASIKFGLLITALVCASAPYSSASVNPARSFGPALLTWYWKNHWIYWVGPIGGAIVSTYLYKYFILNDPEFKSQGTRVPK